MKLSTFARRATAFYQSGKSIYLRSGPGRGKTSTIVEAVPRIASDLNLDLGLVVVSGPNLQPGDTVGFGVPKHNGDRSEMVFTLPFFWRTDEGRYLDEYDGGIIFVDEADKMGVEIKKVMGEMALSGRCGPHRLPKGWVVWMAGNRVEDRSGSTKELDHLINRRYEINITDDVVGWEEWANKSKVHPAIIAFAVQNVQVVFPDKLPEKQGPFCTPRSLVSVGEMLTHLSNDGVTLPTDTDAIEIAAAGIGDAAASQLFATLRLQAELPKLETIIADPHGARLPTKPDAQMLVCYNLAARTESSNIGPIIQYIERMPADFAITYAKSVTQRDIKMVAHKDMLAWCSRNNALMTTIGMLK